MNELWRSWQFKTVGMFSTLNDEWNYKLVSQNYQNRQFIFFLTNKNSSQGRNTKITVVLLQKGSPIPSTDVIAVERSANLTSKCDINPKMLFVLSHNEHLMGMGHCKSKRHCGKIILFLVFRMHHTIRISVRWFRSDVLQANGSTSAVTSWPVDDIASILKNSSPIQIGFHSGNEIRF